MIRIIILDFDGVLVESVDIKTEAFRVLFNEYENVDDIVQYHLQNNAISRFIKFKYIYENLLGKEYNKQTEEEVGKRFSEIVFQKIVDCPFVSGAEDFLKTFSNTHTLYLISATPQKELARIVEKRNIKSYFKKVWGIPPGTKKGYISKSLEMEHANPAEAVYIGDMVDDYRVAQETGVHFIGRRNVESFDGFNFPVFLDMIEIKNWLRDKIE